MKYHRQKYEHLLECLYDLLTNLYKKKTNLSEPVFLFSIFGMGKGSFELGKFVRKVEYEKCDIYQYLQTFINLVKLLFCLFVKHSDLILGLNTLRKCSVFKTSFKKFQSILFKISKLGNFSHQLGIILFCIGNHTLVNVYIRLPVAT